MVMEKAIDTVIYMIMDMLVETFGIKTIIILPFSTEDMVRAPMVG
jgi:hypothetical protein